MQVYVTVQSTTPTRTQTHKISLNFLKFNEVYYCNTFKDAFFLNRQGNHNAHTYMCYRSEINIRINQINHHLGHLHP